MAAKLLPATADRTKVILNVFDYSKGGVRPEQFVVPLSGAGGVTGQTKGQATLVAGTVAVANTAVTASTQVIYSRKTIGGTVGNNSVVITPGVGFTFNSSSNTDTSTLAYVVVY